MTASAEHVQSSAQYGTGHAELYDLVFRSRGKDFAGEAVAIAALVREHRPGADTLLDVACGTGAHLEHFDGLFGHVEGLEYAPAMLEVARRRLPGVPLHGGDMRSFALGRTFDVVTCLGNSAAIGTEAQMRSAVERMASHLAPGGVLVVEPWWFPGRFIDGHVGGHVVHDGDTVVARLTRATRVETADGPLTRHEVRFVVAGPDGITDVVEELHVGLFEEEQYREAFRLAGCAVDLLPPLALDGGRPNAPGLFLATRRG